MAQGSYLNPCNFEFSFPCNKNFDHVSPAKLQNKSLQLSFLPNPPLQCRFYLLGGPMQRVFWRALFWDYPPPSEAAS